MAKPKIISDLDGSQKTDSALLERLAKVLESLPDLED
jgi:hypothetical protein